MAYQFIFGPVPSRRLGLSLGVDLVPHKTCSLDCVYCECGKTTVLTVTPDQYVPVAEVQRELSAFLETAPKLDMITFSGAGEPTLNSGIGEIAAFIKAGYPQYKLTLLTNGTLLYQPEVRRRLMAIDLVVVSVDAADMEGLQAVNRPHPRLTMEMIGEGLIAFRKEFRRTLWAEVFLVPEKNTGEAALVAIRDLLGRIRPDKIQINTLDRPGTEPWVTALDGPRLARAASILQGSELLTSPRGQSHSQPAPGQYVGQILAAVRRRPCTAEDIAAMIGADADGVRRQLERLVDRKKVRRITMPRGIFYGPVRTHE